MKSTELYYTPTCISFEVQYDDFWKLPESITDILLNRSEYNMYLQGTNGNIKFKISESDFYHMMDLYRAYRNEINEFIGHS